MQLQGQNHTVYSVSEVNGLARSLLDDAFADIWMQGEVSGFKAYHSGHWYFSLKDDDAEIRCVMFRGDNTRVRFAPSDGALVRLRCRVSIYEQRGTYQAIAREMQLAGTGELLAAVAALREKLKKEGLTDQSRKRPLPKFAQHLAIITSPAGAALRDIAKTLATRRALCRCTLLPAAVQGANAHREIARAFDRIANWPAHLDGPHPDLVLLARGGGSIEDLWAFNLEPVARAIANCNVPVITGIGHETDTSIADLVADARAATPTAGAALATPDYAEVHTKVQSLRNALGVRLNATLRHLSEDRFWQWRERLAARNPQRIVDQSLQRLDDYAERLYRAYANVDAARRAHAREVAARLHRLDLEGIVSAYRTRLSDVRERLHQAWSQRRTDLEKTLRAASLQLEAVSPRATLARGYAIIAKPTNGERVNGAYGKPITAAHQTRAGDRLLAHLADGRIAVTVQTIHKDSL
ncbi:MAG: exodeoxyribonuclease VII large subunit [Gammaproteobacteria bacterium]|nr:exodeoxyribonuclease VII large subunit [Gammaproteobacteria bacterium]